MSSGAFANKSTTASLYSAIKVSDIVAIIGRLTSHLRFRDNLRDVIESGGLAERRYDTGLGTSKGNLKSQKRVITES